MAYMIKFYCGRHSNNVTKMLNLIIGKCRI